MIALLAGTCLAAPAFGETWLAVPGSSDFMTASNWNPASIPLTTAIFGNSSVTTLTFSGSRNLENFQFNAGAPAYTFNLAGGFGVRFGGNGIVNNSSNAPTFNVNAGLLEFDNASSAGNATINLTAGTVLFLANSTAGTAQLNAAAGTNFNFTATTGPAGNNIITAGSIAGAGNFVLGSNSLVVGSNNLSTTVSGTISGNALTKIGTGTLVLSAANPFSGGTTISGGTIAAANQTAGVVNAIGTGAVTLDGGKLRVDVTADLQNPITFNANKTSTLSAATGQTVTLTNFVTLGANAVAQFGAATDTGTIIYQAGTSADPTASIVVAGGTMRDSGNSLVGLTFDTASTTVNAGAVLDFNDSSNQAIRNLKGNGSVITGTVGGTQLDLYVDASTSTTFGGTISGPGSVMLQTTSGTGGTMIFAGTNTYTGGTDICACTTLQLGTLAAMGSIVGVVFNEGVLNVVNSNTSLITKINNVGGATHFFNGTSASAAEIVNNNGTTTFHDSASAGTANITNRNDGSTTFLNTSTAANATITNRIFGTTSFFNTSTAGAATIINNGGVTNFSDASTAGTADITNRDGGGTFFANTSTAGSAVITNRAFSGTEFANDSNAGHADINNNGGETVFIDKANAGSATITNRNGGGTSFSDTSKAGNAVITNRIQSGTSFELDSSADHAAITNNGGITLFFDKATAGFATITNQNGGFTVFSNETTADNATIITQAGSDTTFFDNSTGGNARFITELGGIVDFSETKGLANDGRISAGSIEGAGTYYIGAGNILSVGGNGLSTEVSGVIADFNPCGCATPGSGTLEKVGAGTLILSGDNTYTGGTRILGGVLQLGNGGTTGTILGNVLNDATFAINRSDVYSFGGVISGVGVFQQNGTGTTVFTATNTYTGGTVINAGTLQLGAGGSLAPTGAMTVNLGGVFDVNGHTQTVGEFSGAGNVILGAGAFTAGGANTTTFSGVMSGTGSFTKAGAGVMTFSGINTYTGPTTVAAGTLLVNGSIAASSGLTVDAGATIGGNGTVPTSTIGGTLSPGNSIGTLSVAGNLSFVGAGNYLVEVSPAAADRTNATGTAALGGTVHALFGPGIYTPKSYTILSAAGGRSGTFANLDQVGLPAFTASLEYTSTDVLLTLGFTLAKVPNLNQNQQSVANAIQNAVNAIGTAAPTPFFALASLPNGALQNALTQVSGEIATGSATAAFQSTDLFLNLMLDPFLETRIADGSVQGRALGFAPEQQTTLPAAMSAYAGLPTKAPPRATFEQRWTVWGAAAGANGKYKGDAVVGSDNLDVNGGIFAAGIDYRVSPDTVIGFAVAGGTQAFGLDGVRASGRSENVQAGVYGSTRFGNGYLSAAAAYGRHDISTERNVAFTSIFDRLTADYGADSFGGRIEGGYRFAATENFGITPYAAVQAQRFQAPNYGEIDRTGILAFALNYTGQSWNDTRTELGARADYRVMMDHGTLLTLRGRAAWAHDYDTNRAINAAFQTLPGVGFTVTGASAAPDSALVSAGAELKFRNGVALRAKFDGAFANRQTVYGGSGGIYVSW